ncbi:MAG: hypothetical protein PWP24_754 [Clostridiales bacterium]|nr:hypothetical protein [Clostridiales bacterium]
MIKNTNMDKNREITSYEEGLALVKVEVEQALLRSPRLIREYLTHLAASQGKYIRAVSVISCAQKPDGCIPGDAVYVAAAIEIIHLASLVHDDVMDDSSLRRGNMTLQKKYGKRTAVICGDYLLSMALRMVSEAAKNHKDMDFTMPDYISRLCLGELEQHINNDNPALSVYRYLKIISGKTAALFEASFYTGALLSGVEQKEANYYRKIGFCAGMIFQLTDDCMDFEATLEEANKPIQTDFENGVITLPLIHAFQKTEGLKKKAQEHKLSRVDINEAVKKSGGLDFTRMVASRYYEKALRCMEDMTLTAEKKERITVILTKAMRR